MTDKLLEGLAAQAFNMAKLDLERHRFNFLFAVYHESDEKPLRRMARLEKVIIEKLGEEWLNNGRTKDVGFFILRTGVDIMPPDAVVFATVVNSFTPTEKLRGLSVARQKELLETTHDRHHEAVAQGLLKVCDALAVIAQTPDRVCFYRQDIDRRGKPVGKPDMHVTPQSEFDGRMKMFGKGKHSMEHL